ncbi:uncharacterized protein LOC121834131 [Ixodes scapularis]|uniref:uncharacterized protein LOC121834131 n=1 Tax=Ixodes scapularis TaxID=6945 RepID=UPI001C37F23D|nr:uncharacterized protein LOC121834131 [Ixodes scapularis]
MDRNDLHQKGEDFWINSTILQVRELRDKVASKACGGEKCWISRIMADVNSILRFMELQLIEIKPMEYGLMYFMDVAPMGIDDDTMYHLYVHVCKLVTILLCTHSCITRIDMKQRHVRAYFNSRKNLDCAIALNKGLNNISIECESWYGEHLDNLLKPICQTTNRITTLCIENTRLTENTCVHFEKMIVMQPLIHVKFHFHMSRVVSNKIIPLLCEKKLETLFLANQSLGEIAALALGKFLSRETCRLKTLSFMNLYYVNNYFDTLGPALGINRSLITLLIRNVLKMTIDDGLSLLNGLMTNVTLKHLTLHHCNMRFVSDALSKMIKHNTTLTYLKLDDYGFTDQFGKDLAEALEYNSNLERLVIDDGTITPAFKMSLIDALSKNTKIKELRLKHSNIDENIVRSLDRSSSYHRTMYNYDEMCVRNLIVSMKNDPLNITKLKLFSYEKYSDTSCLKDFVMSLVHLPFLETLKIKTESRFNDEVAIIFSKYIEGVVNLKNVKISYPQPNDVVKILLEGLRKNNSIIDFDIECNCRCTGIVDYFIEFFKTNTKMETFRTVYVTKDALEKICKSFYLNTSLTHVRLGGPTDCNDGLFQIRKILQRNKSLVNRAVEFVLNPYICSTASAYIYDRLRLSNQLKIVLVDVVEKEEIANKLLRCARNYTICNFFLLTGICKSFMSCYPSNTIQFDSICYDCVIHICSYLNLSDVK